jgi:hypothetical protein
MDDVTVKENVETAQRSGDSIVPNGLSSFYL